MVNYWYIFGLFNLIRLTYQDYKNNMRIDDRYNWLMYGITISLLTHFSKSLSYLFIVIFLGLGLRFLISKFKIMGEGDSNSILWIFTGFAFMDWRLLVGFMGIFVATYLVHFLLRRVLFRRKDMVQGYPVFLVAFIVAGFLLNWRLIG